MAAKVVKKDSKAKSAASGDDGMVCAILAYVLVGIIWYFADEKMKKNSFAKFHTKQALVLLIVNIVLMIAASILAAVLVWIPFVGWIIMSLIWTVISLGIFILWLIGIINAASKKEKELPVIGHFAEKLSF